MNISEMCEVAVREPTLIDALTFAAIWETERALQRARDKAQLSEGRIVVGVDTSYRVTFAEVVKAWAARHGEADARRGWQS